MLHIFYDASICPTYLEQGALRKVVHPIAKLKVQHIVVDPQTPAVIYLHIPNQLVAKHDNTSAYLALVNENVSILRDLLGTMSTECGTDVSINHTSPALAQNSSTYSD
jgi:hypothetical protein